MLMGHGSEEIREMRNRLAGVMDNTVLNVNYILDSGEAGRIALNTAYLYGADTKEQAGGYGGGLTDQSASGQGRAYYEGTLDHDGTDMGSRIIELNAAATGTDAVLKNMLQNNPNVRAYVDSETARIFFGDSVSDIFSTVLHEDYEEKNFESWIKQDEKKQKAAAGAVDEWAGVR